MTNKYNIEISEAILASDEAIRYIDKARSSLNFAQGLGILDLLFGKVFVTFIKQRRINKAEKNIIKARKAIDQLNNEINDVERIIDVDFEMGPILKLADYFFGGRVADLIVLGRLGEAKYKLRVAKTQILEIKVELEELYNRY